MARPTKRTCLTCLTKARLFELARAFDIGTRQGQPKVDFVDALAHSKAASFARVLEERVLSLSNAVVGVLRSASLGIHAIGRGLAAVRGTAEKHAVRRE